MTITARQLIEQARVQHAAFTSLPMPDGAQLLFLNQYQRSVLLKLSGAIEPLVGESTQIAAVISGGLVGVDALGAYYVVSTSDDGYAVQEDALGLYVDLDSAPISLDPFGASGSQPGFPLPAEYVKLINLTAATLYNAQLQVDVMGERSRTTAPQRRLTAFVNGNRLVPMRLGAPPYTDTWNDVTSVTLSYIRMQTLVALTDVVTLPLQLVEVLVAAMAERFAFASTIPLAEKQHFATARQNAESDLKDAAEMILGDVTTSYVHFNG